MCGEDKMIHVIEQSRQSNIRWCGDTMIELGNQYDSVLDVGCGVGRVIRSIEAKEKYGIDVCAKAIAKARKDHRGVKFSCYDLQLVIQGQKQLPKVECVLGLDIIEHFSKSDAAVLLQKCEEAASRCLMWFIPVGYHPQTKDDRGFGNDYHQTHRSIWHPEDMDQLGYEVWYYPNWHAKHKPPKEKGAMWCRKLLV